MLLYIKSKFKKSVSSVLVERQICPQRNGFGTNCEPCWQNESQ